MSTTESNAQPESNGGQILGMEPLDRETRIALLEEAHSFPCPFKIVVIAHAGKEFLALLRVTLEQLQGDDPFEIEPHASSKGTYISYRVHAHVADAATALDRKDSLAELTGVVTLL